MDLNIKAGLYGGTAFGLCMATFQTMIDQVNSFNAFMLVFIFTGIFFGGFVAIFCKRKTELPTETSKHDEQE